MTQARVAIENGALILEGQPLWLWGGELQYFRVRAKDFDPGTTKRMWAQTLESMAQMGMNLVSTYVPWDYHEPAPGQFDFDGAKDLLHFLELCHERGFFVALKPGPYITAEWPKGWRSFGAIPHWLPDRIPEACVQSVTGKPFTYDPIPSGQGRLCTPLHPEFLDYVARWFAVLAPIIKRFISEQSSIVMLQLDNETNLFWRSHYWIDYSETSLRQYREFLSARYGQIDRLNEAYGRRYTRFEEVYPPTRPPSPRKPASPDNAWRRDWFDAGRFAIETYLVRLRELWEGQGISAQDVLFTTNDTLQYPPLPAKWGDLLFPDIRSKGRAGTFTLDSYPRCDPLHRGLSDRPFLPEFNLHHMRLCAPAPQKGFAFAAEIQGGMFSLPLLKIGVRTEQTSQLLCKLFGNGLRGGSVYVIREGLHWDQSPYAYQSALDFEGRPTPRFACLRKWGQLLSSDQGKRLLRSSEAPGAVGVVVDLDETCRLEGGCLDERSLWGHRYAAWLGFLTGCGFSPRIVDASNASSWEGLRVAIFLNSGRLREDVAEALLAGLDQGITLAVLPCWPQYGRDGVLGPLARKFVEKLLPLTPMGAGRHERLRYRIADVSGVLRPRGRVRAYAHPSGFEGVLWPDGKDHGFCGLRFGMDRGSIHLMGLDLAEEYGTSAYDTLSGRERWERRRFFKALLNREGIAPLLSWQDAFVTAWLRIGDRGELVLFALNDSVATSPSVRLVQPEILGIEPDRDYVIADILNGERATFRTGRQLHEEGVRLKLEKFGCSVHLIAPP